MADISFSKPTYANGVNALSAATFQPLANVLDEIAHQANRTGVLAADTVPGMASGTHVFSTSGSGGDDGNSGQPPAPKPTGYDAALTTIGSTCIVEYGNGNTGTLIPGDAATGQVFWACPVYDDRIGGAAYGIGARQATIGTTSCVSAKMRVWFWRIA